MNNNFIPCISTNSCSGSLTEKLKVFAETGFKAVEIDIDIRPSNQQIKEAVTILKDYNLIIADTTKLRGWFELDGSLMGVNNDWEAIQSECLRRMETTAMLGANLIIACPSFSNRGFYQELSAGVDRYKQILELGKQFKVAPTFEFMGQTKQINTVQKTIDFMQRLDTPDLKVVIDSYHIWRGSSDLEDYAKISAESISSLHIADNDPCITKDVHCDRERLFPCEGNLPLKRFLQIAKDIGFHGPLSLGVYKYRDQSPDYVSKIGMAALLQVIQSSI